MPTVVVCVFEIAKQQARQQRLETIAVAVGFAGLALSLLAIVPESGVLSDTTGSNGAPAIAAIRSMLGVSASESLTAYLASGLYRYGWVLGLGGYFAYRAGSLLAEDVEHDRMEMLLSAPVSRSAIVRERFFALLVAMVQINVIVCVVVYLGALTIGTPLEAMDLLVTHTLSIPYLLVCGAIGLLFSVGTTTSSRASWGSVAVVFGLFVLERYTNGWIGALSPSHYYDPAAILTEHVYPVTDGAILLGAALVISSVARLWFRSTDLRT